MSGPKQPASAQSHEVCPLGQTKPDDELVRSFSADSPDAHMATCEPCRRRAVQLVAQLFKGYRKTAGDDFLPPAAVGWYELDTPPVRLGVGGAGVVYAATNRNLGRRVVVKFPHPPGSDTSPTEWAGMALRLMAEGRRQARVNHPNVVRVLAAGICTKSGFPFLVAERTVLLTGGAAHLGEVLADRKVAPRDAVRWVSEAAAGVAAAHREGVVHRDIKLDNLLLTRNPATGVLSVLVTDFGLAASMGAANAGIGTPGYCPPEANAPGSVVGPAGDVYGLCVVLTELLTRRRPQVGQSVRLNLPGGSLRYTDEIEWLLTKGLSENPADRPRDAEVFAAALDAYLSGRPVPGFPSGLWRRSEKLVRRRPITTVVAGALVVIVAGSWAGFGWKTVQVAQAEVRLKNADQLSEEQKAEIRRISMGQVFESGRWAARTARDGQWRSDPQWAAEAASARAEYESYRAKLLAGGISAAEANRLSLIDAKVALANREYARTLMLTSGDDTDTFSESDRELRLRMRATALCGLDRLTEAGEVIEPLRSSRDADHAVFAAATAGVIQFCLGRPKDAVSLFEEAICVSLAEGGGDLVVSAVIVTRLANATLEADPSPDAARQVLALLDDAIPTLQRAALTHRVSLGIALDGRGTALGRLDRLVEARSSLEAADGAFAEQDRIAPGTVDREVWAHTLTTLAGACRSLMDWPAAVVAHERALVTLPPAAAARELVRARIMYAATLVTAQEVAASHLDWVVSSGLAPTAPWAYFFRLKLPAKVGDIFAVRARELCDRADSIAVHLEDRADSLAQRATTHILLGDLPRALTDLTTAAELNRRLGADDPARAGMAETQRAVAEVIRKAKK